jgi:bifunctional non-homologous end joining protein LigD
MAKRQLELTHLDKMFWPKEGITKGDLLHYYEKISPWLLPYLKDRPVSLKRFPGGIDGPSFFQKNIINAPRWIKTAPIKHQEKTVNYLLIQNETSLLFAINSGCIELHPFFSRYSKLHSPDYMVFDLDPKGASFANVIDIAKLLHETLEEMGVASYCKTSGATGLHIAVPLGAKYKYEEVQQFAKGVATEVQKQLSNIATLERAVAKRRGKVYIDYLQNHFGQTLAVPYGVRARAGATVSTPLKWEEVRKGLDPRDFTIETIFKRLKKYKDLYAPVLGKGAKLTLHVS